MQRGDIVSRISYHNDIIFIIRDIKNDIALLEGLYIRIIATAPLSDLIKINNNDLERLNHLDNEYYNQVVHNAKKNIKHITGKILHFDSDPKYLKKCLKLYKDLNIYAYGVCVSEENIENNILDLIADINPDIVILTGHDSYNKKGILDLNNYTNTSYFINAIKKVRKYYSKDHIFIFAGACQSNFEAIIASGANFASSPKRINIDVYDPAIVGIKAACTSITDIVSINEIFIHSRSKEGISGIESFGKMRLLL